MQVILMKKAKVFRVNKERKWVRRALCAFTVICVFASILFVVDSYARSVERPQYNFSDFSGAEAYEGRIIEEFYEFVPELVSEGKWFDVKLESGFGGNITIVKKVDELFDITITIECFDGNRIIKKRYMRMTVDGGRNFRSLASKEYVLDNVISRMDTANGDMYFRKMVDKIVIVIEYAGGEEEHILKADSNKEHELFELRLRSFYENSDSDYGASIRRQIGDHANSLMLTDFDKWYEFAKQLVNNYEENGTNFETTIVKKFSHELLFLKVDENSYLSEDDLRKYLEIYEWYSEVVVTWH